MHFLNILFSYQCFFNEQHFGNSYHQVSKLVASFFIMFTQITYLLYASFTLYGKTCTEFLYKITLNLFSSVHSMQKNKRKITIYFGYLSNDHPVHL